MRLIKKKAIRYVSLLLVLLILCPGMAALATDSVERNASTNVSMTVVTDTAPPEVTIQIGGNTWKEWLSIITFGLVFSDTQTVKLTATDNFSGVDKLYYLTSPVSLTAEAVQDVSLVWTEIENGGIFSVDPYAKMVVYAKATDREGNTGYYCSDGFIVQKCCAAEDGVLLVMDRAAQPETEKVMLCAYDSEGKFLTCRWGSEAENGWLFDSSIVGTGATWKCFFFDGHYRPVQEEITLAAL